MTAPFLQRLANPSRRFLATRRRLCALSSGQRGREMHRLRFHPSLWEITWHITRLRVLTATIRAGADCRLPHRRAPGFVHALAEAEFHRLAYEGDDKPWRFGTYGGL